MVLKVIEGLMDWSGFNGVRKGFSGTLMCSWFSLSRGLVLFNTYLLGNAD